MIHDFEKYCNNLEMLFGEEQQQALEQLQRLKTKNRGFLLIGYTNNKALNILLSEKMKKCEEINVDFQINAEKADLSFIDDMDVVSIFANLIDNAIEGCIRSKEKKIFLSIYTMNNAYVVVRIDNSSDTAPVVVNNKLKTSKKDKEKHGIGLISVKKALKNYKGNIKWDFDPNNSIFTTTIIMECTVKKQLMQNIFY